MNCQDMKPLLRIYYKDCVKEMRRRKFPLTVVENGVERKLNISEMHDKIWHARWKEEKHEEQPKEQLQYIEI